MWLWWTEVTSIRPRMHAHTRYVRCVSEYRVRTETCIGRARFHFDRCGGVSRRCHAAQHCTHLVLVAMPFGHVSRIGWNALATSPRSSDSEQQRPCTCPENRCSQPTGLHAQLPQPFQGHSCITALGPPDGQMQRTRQPKRTIIQSKNQ